MSASSISSARAITGLMLTLMMYQCPEGVLACNRVQLKQGLQDTSLSTFANHPLSLLNILQPNKLIAQEDFRYLVAIHRNGRLGQLADEIKGLFIENVPFLDDTLSVTTVLQHICRKDAV